MRGLVFFFSMYKYILKFLFCFVFNSRALSIAEIDEINQNRPSSSSSNAYPFINIIHPEESEDIYAEQNRVPTLCWENLSQAQVE